MSRTNPNEFHRMFRAIDAQLRLWWPRYTMPESRL